MNLDPNPNAKHRPKRSKVQKELDRLLIERCLIRRMTLREISEKIGAERPYTLSIQQVQKDAAMLRDKWRKETMEATDKWMERELSGLDEQEREAWSAWERSKQDAVTKMATKEGQASGKASVKTEGQCGDPAYLRHILDVRERRAKLLGLDAPSRSELSGPMGESIKVDYKEIPDEHLTALLLEKLTVDKRDAGQSQA